MPKDALLDFDAHRRRLPPPTIDRMGPISVLITNEEWGRKYTLMLGDKRIESWASHPGWAYSKDALVRASMQGIISDKECTEVLIRIGEFRRKTSKKPEPVSHE